MNISQLVQQSYEMAKEKGWWDDPDPNFAEKIALCHTELSEALEEFRMGRGFNETYFREDGKPEGIPSELADEFIRIADLCGYFGIDLEQAIMCKMEFNATRSHRHGGKKI